MFIFIFIHENSSISMFIKVIYTCGPRRGFVIACLTIEKFIAQLESITNQAITSHWQGKK